MIDIQNLTLYICIYSPTTNPRCYYLHFIRNYTIPRVSCTVFNMSITETVVGGLRFEWLHSSVNEITIDSIEKKKCEKISSKPRIKWVEICLYWYCVVYVEHMAYIACICECCKWIVSILQIVPKQSFTILMQTYDSPSHIWHRYFKWQTDFYLFCTFVHSIVIYFSLNWFTHISENGFFDYSQLF